MRTPIPAAASTCVALLATLLAAIAMPAAASAAYDYDSDAANLRVTTASVIGSVGADRMNAVAIAPDGQIVLAGTLDGDLQWGDQATSATTDLLGGGHGAIVRLNPTGRSLLGVTRIGTGVADVAVDGSGRIATAGDHGVAVLGAEADTVLWQALPGTPATRVASGSAGSVVALAGNRIHVLRADGSARATIAAAPGVQLADVAVDDTSARAFGIGTRSVRLASGRAVSVGWLAAWSLDGGTPHWVAYDHTAAELGATGMVAPTAGLRVAVGQDGMVYAAMRSTGPATMLHRDPRQPSRPLSSGEQVSYDTFNQVWHTNGRSYGWYGRFAPTTGNLLKGQFLVARSAAGWGADTTITDIAADELGTVHVAGQATCCTEGRDQRLVGSAQLADYAGPEAFTLVTSPDFTRRLTWTSLAAGGGHRSSAVGIDARGGMAAVASAAAPGSALVTTRRAARATPAGGADAHLVTWGGDSFAPVATAVAAIASPQPGAVLSDTATVQVGGADPAAVARVDVLLDGAPAGSTTAAPYSVDVDTRSVDDGSHLLSLRVTGTDGSVTRSAPIQVMVDNAVTAGLSATYYDRIDFTGATMSRSDPNVQFDWRYGTPSEVVGTERFAARWTGQVYAPVSGTYQFHTTSDDGARLTVAGARIIDRWYRRAGDGSGTIWLEGGRRHDITLEYFEDGGTASMRLDWTRPGGARETVPPTALSTRTPRVDGGLAATYYDRRDFSGTTVTRTDGSVDFDWGGSSPDARLGVDTFSSRWTGSVRVPRSGSWTFHVTADDGVRLYVGGRRVVNAWYDQSATTHVATLDLVAGRWYDLRLEYYERSGSAIARMQWSGPGQGAQLIPAGYMRPERGVGLGSSTGLTATYFDHRDFSGGMARRIDSDVDFDWGEGGPDDTIYGDGFAARWEGTVQVPRSATWRFHVTSDDGVRLWVNGRRIVDRWRDQAPTATTGSITLLGGRSYAIRMDYYEAGGGAMAKLEWSVPNVVPRQVIPSYRLRPVHRSRGLSASYFATTDLSGVAMRDVDPNIDFDWDDGAPMQQMPDHDFSARWTGWLVVPATGRYTFRLRASNGARLWLGGALRIDDWAGSASDYSPQLYLRKGQRVPIAVDYVAYRGDAEVHLAWRVPKKSSYVPVPQAVLRP